MGLYHLFLFYLPYPFPSKEWGNRKGRLLYGRGNDFRQVEDLHAFYFKFL
jgi:hypothetical protein